MPTPIALLVHELETRLRAIATPERAAGEKAYLKSGLGFLGASYWETGRLATEIVRRERPARDEAISLAEALWAEPIFERRAAAVTVLERCAGELSPGDLPFLERLLRESGTWALVDGLAASVVGDLARREPEAVTPALDRWARDSDLWVRRASLLAELQPLRTGAPFDRFARRADAMLDEKEFFIRKAIGWVLRETAKRRPAEVIAWLARRTHRASGVTMREAVKYLPAPDADRLMKAYRAHRPAAS